MSLHPIILSGGAGTRLWPLSRESLPKQFQSFGGPHTLLQATVLRCHGLADLAPAVVVSNHEHRFLVAQQLQEAGVVDARVVLEPFGRNTAPAVALAALVAQREDAEAVLLVLPSDHLIPDGAAFRAQVTAALPAARAGHLVTFGIRPRWAETGYGYIALGAPLAGDDPCLVVDRFIEKPDAERAAALAGDGRHAWNSGMFLMSARAVLDELRQLRPEVLAACESAVERGVRDLDFLRVDASAMEPCPSVSIDHAVFEHTRRAAVKPVDFAWSDLGSWKALWDIGDHDASGNVVHGEAVLEDVHDSYVHAQGRLVAAVGLSDIVVVETPDAVLVARRERAQDVRLIVARLLATRRPEGVIHRRVYRPWGTYETVDAGERFQVKRITVNPGASLSLQMHHHRAEHWIVVRGTARVTRGDEVMTLAENQSTYIPLGVRHRLENPGRIPLELIEVQSGAYLGDDDIVRFEDHYNRN